MPRRKVDLPLCVKLLLWTRYSFVCSMTCQRPHEHGAISGHQLMAGDRVNFVTIAQQRRAARQRRADQSYLERIFPLSVKGRYTRCIQCPGMSPRWLSIFEMRSRSSPRSARCSSRHSRIRCASSLVSDASSVVAVASRTSESVTRRRSESNSPLSDSRRELLTSSRPLSSVVVACNSWCRLALRAFISFQMERSTSNSLPAFSSLTRQIISYVKPEARQTFRGQ